MDEQGFRDLWLIAQSKKRDGEEPPERLPIGKFGIGKLATYALGRHLTHISKVGGTILAAQMKYDEIEPNQSIYQQRLDLPLRELNEDDAKGLMADFVDGEGPGYDALRLFGEGAAESWTVAIVGVHTDLARQIKLGRLNWILSTALPMSPGFRLYVNGREIESTKEEIEILKEWTLGVDDDVAAEMKLTIVNEGEGGPAVDIPGIGPVRGRVRIYKGQLTSGKSAENGRSHGFFVMVRERLVNMDDPLFGLPALSHGPFTRFWMRVDADGLDDLMRSTRESVLENQAVITLKAYLTARFNEARTLYQNWLDKQEESIDLAVRLAGTPSMLSSGPMIRVVAKVAAGSLSPLLLTEVTKGLDHEAVDVLVAELTADAESDEGLVREVKLANLGVDSRLARFIVSERVVHVNADHPFYLNYGDLLRRSEPFEIIALAEVFSETHLLDEGVDEDAVKSFVKKRDRLLRELVYTTRLSAPMVSRLVEDAVADETGLERALALAFRSLGFEVTPIGGKGTPDGLALARLGVRDGDGPADYSVTLEAKSTGKKSVKADIVGASRVARHKADYSANFAVVTAVNFEGGTDAESAVCKEAIKAGITLIRATDLSRLVGAAATRRVGFSDLRDWLSSCKLPDESTNWIDDLLGRQPEQSPLKNILEAAWELASKLQDPVKIAAIQAQLADTVNLKQDEIEEWLELLVRLVPELVGLDNETVNLELPPEKLLEVAAVEMAKLPEGVRNASALGAAG